MAIGPAIALTLLSRGLGFWLGGGACVVMGAGLLISGSRAGIGGIAMAVLAIAVLSRRLEIAAGIVGAAVAGVGLLITGIVRLPAGNALARLFGTDDQTVARGVSISDSMRQEQFEQGLARVFAHPFTGVGFEDALAAHDIYLQLWASAGVLGVLGIAVVIAGTLTVPARGLLVRWWPTIPPPVLLHMGFAAGFFAYLITGLFFNALWDRYIWLIPSVLAALTPSALAHFPAARVRAPSASPAPMRPVTPLPRPADSS